MITETFVVGMPAITVIVTIDESDHRVSVDPCQWSTSAGVTAGERRRVNSCLARAVQFLQQ